MANLITGRYLSPTLYFPKLTFVIYAPIVKITYMKPEQRVQLSILAQAKLKGWFLLVTDSTATYSADVGIYKQSHLPKGTLDLTGSDAFGHAVFVEVKAPGKLANLSPEQRKTLLDHIDHGRFAVVADSYQRLFDIHQEWLARGRCREFLLACVPQKRKRKSKVSVPSW